MLGFGKVPGILTTREVEEVFEDGLRNCARNDEVWVISPYNTLDKLSTIRRAITEACKADVRVKYVVRDETEQVDGARRALAEALENGLELFALERLHAKLYWFEHSFAIVTSANMVDASFDKSIELGLYVPTGGLFDDLRRWIGGEIVGKCRRIQGGSSEALPRSVPASTPRADVRPKDATRGGYCLRCGAGIPLNKNAPYCRDDYKVWAQFGNASFVEKYCHACGSRFESTMDRPLCRECFKRS